MSAPDDPPSGDVPASRRAFLAAVGTGAAAGLAGCSALQPDDEPAPYHHGDWRTFGAGPRNHNRVDGGTPEPVGFDRLAPGDWTHVPPVVQDGTVYFAAGREVRALSPAAAVPDREAWSQSLNAEVSGAPALDPDRDRLYVPTRTVRTTDAPDPAPASLTALSMRDGALAGSVRVGDRATYGVTVADGDCYVRSATACVRLDPDGGERWRRPLDPLIYDEYNLGDSTATQIAPAVAGDAVFVPDRDALVCIDRERGTERWRVPVDTPYAAAVVDPGGVIQTGWRETVAVDLAGEVRWRRDLHSRAPVAVGDGDVYVAAHDLHELDPASGETTWQAHLPSEGTAAPVVTDDDVLVASGDLRAYRRDRDGLLTPDRVRWRYDGVHATTYASPVIAAGRVLVASPTGLVAVRAVDAPNGSE
ncbi:outer membrane protein assembly factor BamB family protein [Halopenitus persicus]|uniref:Outer membrane protein assembly factor BamB, contains PQQ-like beta-propeller repeat n=1 Tax=Halopenitus persicus TaxID=1048396 RepID=A0A1H3E9K8_9EURY|nr:PQQ-binding-like beta-propeller repeat protein [Halopenitus persicus]SDX74604.1 Outer membrane protein assembly factor BamB, contains PQQ-like beta-propeller repeat [Halopenitus persicus]